MDVIVRFSSHYSSSLTQMYTQQKPNLTIPLHFLYHLSHVQGSNTVGTGFLTIT